MLKPEEISGILLRDEYIKEHGVSYFSLSDEYYYDENGVYHYERMFDKPMDEGGKPFTGVAFETFEDSDQIAFYIEYQDGYQCGGYVRYYENGALRGYVRIDEKEYYVYEWYESGALQRMMECCKVRGQDRPSRETEWHENGVLKKTKEWRYKREQTMIRSREYDETGKLIRKEPK